MLTTNTIMWFTLFGAITLWIFQRFVAFLLSLPFNLACWVFLFLARSLNRTAMWMLQVRVRLLRVAFPEV